MSQTTFLIVAGVSLALLAASGNIDGFRARPRMPQRVLSQAELQLFTTTRSTGEIVMAGSSGVVIDQGNQAIRVGTSAITFMAGTTADTEVVRIGENGNVGIGTTNSEDRLAVQGTMRLNGTSAALSLNDGNSGLTYSSTVNAFVGSGTGAKPSNGPVLFGQLDGALGTKSGGQANALYWNTTGVGIKNNAPAYALDVTGGVHATSNAVFDANVGIGNSSPAYKLDVTGGVHATSNAIFDSKVGIGNSAPGANYALDVTGGVHATSNAIFDSKVGIGTNAPGASYALDVVGNVNFTGSLYQGGSLFKTSQWNTTGSDIVYTAGKIGIGVTQPTSALHVSSGSEVNLANAIVVKNVSTTSLAASVNTGVTAATLESRWGLSYNSSNSVLTLSRESNATVGRSGLYTTFPTPFPVGTIFTVTINYGPYNNSSPVPRPYFTANDSAGYLVGVAAFPSITTSTAAANYTLTYTLTAPTPRFGLDWEGAQGAFAQLFSFSASVQTPVTSTAVNVGIGSTNPTSNFQLATGSTFDLGTAKASWTDTGITAATVKASGVNVNGAVTGPDANGYYTFTVNSGWSGGVFVYLPTSMVQGATYQITVTMRSSFATAPLIVISDNRSKNFIVATLTGTGTSYTSSAVMTTSTQLMFAIGNGASNMTFQFKDLRVLRLDTSLSGNVGVNTTTPDSQLTIVGSSASAASSSLTLAQPWKTQQAIYAADTSYALKFGAHYTSGVGAYSSIQSTEFYSGTEHPGNLSLNPLGGSVGIGVTNPLQGLLQVAGRSMFGYVPNVRGGMLIDNELAYGGSPCIQAVTSTLGTNNLTINPNGGYVGIGTTVPIAALHVQTAQWHSTNVMPMVKDISGGNGYYFGYWQNITTWNAGFSADISIYARFSIMTSNHIISASDERIKKNIQPVQEALDKIKRLDVVSYDRIDYRERGVDVGVLARNVRSVLPKAVHTSRHMIPNIYLPATHVKINSGVLIEVKCDDKDIKEGSKVKLMIMQGDKEIEHLSNMKNWTGSSFEVEEWKGYSEEDKVFAYGVEVDDFLNVDKEQVGILAACAVKELLAIVEDQKGRVEALERAVQTLR